MKLFFMGDDCSLEYLPSLILEVYIALSLGSDWDLFFIELILLRQQLLMGSY